MKKKILLVFGTRPEAIKLAPLIKELGRHTDRFDTRVCITAQHREMLDQVLSLFSIRVDYDLNLMKPNQDLFEVTTGVLAGMRSVLREYTPDLVLVHGDTTTTMTASLAAFYCQIDVGHVEAGLRTNDIYSPYPEEINRQLTSRITKYHFAPTDTSRKNLISEGIDSEQVYVTGNTVIDALLLTHDRITSDTHSESNLNIKFQEQLGFDIAKTDFVLITGHRRENFGDGMESICRAIRELAEKYGSYHFVYPVHMNPNVRKPVEKLLSDTGNIHLIEPLDYEPFIYLMANSTIILTDSGGIQEEAPSLGKPVLVMRDTTERPEAIEAGTVRLVGTNQGTIVRETTRLIENESDYQRMARAHNPYGDGMASKRIVAALKASL